MINLIHVHVLIFARPTFEDLLFFIYVFIVVKHVFAVLLLALVIHT